MTRVLSAILISATLLCACSRGTAGQALEVVVTVDGEAVASCVKVEASSNGVSLSTRGLLRKDTLEVAVAGGALENPVTLIARGFVGSGCQEPLALNLESAAVETTFQEGKVRKVTLALHAPGPETDTDSDGHRDGELDGPDCESTRADVHPGQPELCGNGLDDDCDSLIDCAQPSCSNRGPAERCDGRDNDCDGATDEGFTPGYLCTAGLSTCAREGLLICAVDGASSRCSVTPDLTQATDEVCNGVDEDCDGAADNGFSLGAICQAGLGSCARMGTVVCMPDGGAGCSVSPGLPTRELCDGLDNDCDGTPDQRPACGGPSLDVTEQPLASWGVSESLSDVPEPCSDVTRGLISVSADLSPPWAPVGTQAIKLNYGPDGLVYFAAHYPAGRDAGWDLSLRTGIALAVAGSQPSTYGGWSPPAPTIILCGRDGGYMRLDPLGPVLSTDGGLTMLQVPFLGVDAGVSDAGWTTLTVAPFDLRTVDSLEVHADPTRGAGTGNCTVWLDDLRFY